MADLSERYAIDPALAELAADKHSTARRPPAHVPIAKVRDAANAAMRRQPPGPEIFRIWEEVIITRDGALTLRFYRPDAAAPVTGIMFAHGGGFTLGDLDTHDPQCRALARHSGSLVVAVDYRLAPEHCYPAGLDDCAAAREWLVSNSEQLGIDKGNWAFAGDSAGANLILSLAIRLRGERWRPAALALVYPFLDPHCSTTSARQLVDGPGLSRGAMLWFWENYLGPKRDFSAVELLRQDLSGLPPTSLVLAPVDPLIDEGRQLAVRLEQAGVPVTCRIYVGMVHGFLHLSALTPQAEQAVRDIAGDLREALSTSSGRSYEAVIDTSSNDPREGR